MNVLDRLARGLVILTAVIVWERGDGTRTIGSGPLPDEICRRELAALLRMFEADRGNYGQSGNGRQWWIVLGECVPAASPPTPR